MLRHLTLVAGGFALAAGLPFASLAQQGAAKSWGPSHTTYWSTEATGNIEPGKSFDIPMVATQPAAQAGPQRLYYRPPAKRTRATTPGARPGAQMRPRQQQQKPAKPAQPPTDQGAQPPAERGQQPPADAKPGAPPSGQQPEGEQPKDATPK